MNHGWQSEPTDGSKGGWSVGLSICLCISLSIYLSIYLTICLSICRSIDLSIYLSTYLSIYLSISKLGKRSNSARLPWNLEVKSWKTMLFCEFSFKFGSWQHQKHSNSARLSPNMEVVHIQKLSNAARLPSNMESWVLSWQHRTNAFCDFSILVSKVLRLPLKSEARSYEVLHLSREIILANLKIRCSKIQHVSGNRRPDLPTSLMKMSLVLRLPRDMHLCRSSSNVPRLPWFLKLLQSPHVLLSFGRCWIPCACRTKWRVNVQKCSEHAMF